MLPRLNMLADERIQVHAQIVLCPGYNVDGEILRQTVHELAALHPDRRETYGAGVLLSALRSCRWASPSFATAWPHLTTCSPEFTRALVSEVDAWRTTFRATLGTNFVFLSDEIYLSAGAPIPPTKQYEGFPWQLEDGVGLVRQFMDDHAKLAKKMPPAVGTQRSGTLVTGEPGLRL